MSGTLSGLASVLARVLYHRPKAAVAALVRLELAACYVKGIRAARLSLIAFIVLLLCVGLLLLGFAFVHVGFLLCFCTTQEEKGWFLLICGGVYFLLALAAILVATSQRIWMRCTKASDVVDAALRRRSEKPAPPS